MSAIERQQYLQKITQRLIIFTGAVLLLMAIGLFGLDRLPDADKHSYLTLLVFVAGLLGGFVSIQQRLPKITLDELRILSGSWISITLIPINGGIFALVLMVMFIGNIIQGNLFPDYKEFKISDVDTFKTWLTSAYPLSGADVAKLLFWSFVAGFSERFVPQIIRRTAEEVKSAKSDETIPAAIRKDDTNNHESNESSLTDEPTIKKETIAKKM